MSVKPLLIRLSAMSVAVALILGANVASADIEQSRLDAISSDLQARIADKKLSGAVVLVAQGGEVELFEAYGQQNVEDGVPMTKDSIFRIFSMTKPIAGTALMLLHDEGKFSLDDPVAKHIPEYQNLQVFTGENDDGSFATEPANHQMTVRELMSHTGGLMYVPPLSQGPVADAYLKAGVLNPTVPMATMMPKLADIPLGYQPGTQWVYSISVDVQGYLVERLSGKPFDVFLQERLFDPLGMEDTGFYVAADKLDRFARQYAPGPDGNLRRSDTGQFTRKPAFFSGGGGLTSTAADYLKFAQMHLNGGVHEGKRIISEEAIGLMRANQLPDAVANIGQLYPGNVFGLDFAVVEDSAAFDGAPVGTHWWWGIAGSWFWIDPESDIVMIGMIQNDDIFYSIQTHGAMRRALYQ